MAIQFSTLRFKNFLSSGNAFTEIQFDSFPTNLVVGKNGAGKSTMLDALCFSLFGKPFRNINKPQLVNSINQKNCVAEIEFSIGKQSYKIVRGIKPNIFEIYQNGVMLDQSSASKDYQKYLEDNILKLNFKSFTQIVILGVASFTPFMELPAASRREIIEDILDIRIFTTMNILLKEKLGAIKEQLSAVESDLSVNKTKTMLQDKYIQSLQADKQDRIDELTSKIVLAEDEITQRVAQIESLGVAREELFLSIADASGVRLSNQKITLEIADLEKAEKKLAEEKAFYIKHSTCPTCNQDISKDFKAEKISSFETSSNSNAHELELLREKKVTLNSLVEEINRVEKKVADLERTISNLEVENKVQRKNVTSLMEERTKLEKKGGNIEQEKAKLRQMATDVLALSKLKSELKEEKDYHDVATALLKDGGVKTRIIKQYLPAINKMVNKYLHAMDFFASFELNEQFSETIKSRHRDEFSYESFSQGEKQRIDLALVFTWRTIAKMKNSTSTNLLILDEVFDSSLDSEGTDYVVNLLKTIGEQTNVWVISHKPDVMADKFNNVLRFVKKNNYSILEKWHV